jgi:hypothetical protein
MTLANMPTVTIEFYLNSAWVDVTQYVRAGSTRIGRRDELDTFQPGQITLVVDNRDRRFDPLNTSGPYYGYLLPGPAVQVRARATWSATTYDIFSGYIDGWGLSPQVDGDSTLTLEGFDFLGYYARVSVARDALTMREIQAFVYYGSITNDVLEAWIPLGGTDVVAKDVRYAANRDYTFTSTPRQGESISRYVQGASTAFDGTYGAIGPAIPMRATAHESVTTIFVQSTTAGSTGQLNPILASASYPQARLGIDDQGRFAFVYDTVSIHSGLPGNDGNWHCVQLVHSPSSAVHPDQWEFIIDGISLGTTDTQAGSIEWQLLAFGAPGSGDDAYFTGSLAHLYVVSNNSQLEVYELPYAGLHGQYVSTGYPAVPDYAPAHMTQLHADGPFSAPTTSYDAGTVKIGALKWNSTKLDIIYQMTLAERGRIFIDAAGTWVFHDRSHDTTATRSVTSQATFADTGSATVVPISAIGAIRNGSRFTAQGVTINLPDGQTIQR